MANLIKWNPESLRNAPGKWNPLPYAGNDPVNFVDPSGREITAAIGLVGVVVGASGVSAYGLARGSLWLANASGAMGNAEYSSKVSSLNRGAIASWNKVYRPLVENTMSFIKIIGPSLSITKGLSDMYFEKDSFLIGGKTLSKIESSWRGVSPIIGFGVSHMLMEASVNVRILGELYWKSIDEIMSKGFDSMRVENK